jgi:hypothetical protein
LTGWRREIRGWCRTGCWREVHVTSGKREVNVNLGYLWGPEEGSWIRAERMLRDSQCKEERKRFKNHPKNLTQFSK